MKKHGGTLIEVMIAVAIVGIISLVAIPNLLQAKLVAQEAYAIDVLRHIYQEQNAFRTEAVVDQDEDQKGEYGLLGELAGAIVPRNASLRQPVKRFLPIDLGTKGKEGKGFALSHGYRFVIYLPGEEDKPGNDKSLGGWAAMPGLELDPQAQSVTINQQEQFWCAYAWPENRGSTGTRTFFINEKGEVYTTDGEKAPYSGNRTPAATAAYEQLVFKSDIGGEKPGIDGNAWKSLEPVPEAASTEEATPAEEQ